MKSWIFVCIIFAIISVLSLLEADAMDFNDVFLDSGDESIKNDVRQVFVPPANTYDSIRYYLYTQSNPKDACFMEPTPEEFDCCPFNPNLETKIFIHGFIQTWKNDSYFQLIKDALLKQGSYNVIYVDWSRYNGYPYTLAVMNTIPVGEKIAEFIKFVKRYTGARYGSFHLIGHSLGAHVAGITGKHVCNLGRITGLDPAGPLYELDNRKRQLYYTDAKFVDVIHTSDVLTGQGLGKYEPVGHMDFYPNGGRTQPNCEKAARDHPSGDVIADLESPFNIAICNHMTSMDFFLYSIQVCEYLSTRCEDYDKLTTCSSQGNPTARMGFFAKRIEGLPVKSKFYLKTSRSKPFC